MIPQRIIEHKRDGGSVEPADLRAFLRAYLDGEVSEAQMAAFLMAVLFRGLSAAELGVLVDATVDSGRIVPRGDGDAPRVDKHSTGGVGDKVSLALAPLAAELGVRVPMISGRALGHTGGTLDKLEAIPGFRTSIDLRTFGTIVDEVGCAVIGASESIAPLDRRLYRLRDVTGTVPSVPLIAASIVGKKLTENLDGLVLDVKVGRGAVLSDRERTEELAGTMVELASARDVETVAVLTAMDRPLGRAVGNGLEAAEAFRCLAGEGPDDLAELTATLAGEMLGVAGRTESALEGRERALDVLQRGSALERAARMVERQGGDPSVVFEPGGLPRAPERVHVTAERAGHVQGVDPVELGYGVIGLGGGRTRIGQELDPRVGFVLDVVPGDAVEPGRRLGTVHAARPEDAERGKEILSAAVSVAEGRPADPLPLVGRRIDASSPPPRTGA